MERSPERNGVFDAWHRLRAMGTPWTGLSFGKIDGRSTFDPKTDLRSDFPRFKPESLKANQPIVQILRKVADRKNATPGQIALAWVSAQKSWIVPIPGTSKLAHLVENVAAADVDLDPSDLREIDSAAASINVVGGRMNAEQMAQVER